MNSQNSIQALDSFLRELSKRLLKLPQWYSNTPACIAAGQRSARALCLTGKLNFLQKISAKDTNEAVSAQTFSITLRRYQLYLPSSGMQNLEHYFGTDFTSAIFKKELIPVPTHAKLISSKDRDLLLAKQEGRAYMSIVVEVESEIGWPQLWDLVLDNGARCIEGLRNLLWVITFPPPM